ncbi:phosphomevalonate kinase [Streptococcus sp. 20-1249]|uniref:phosphomevalonate kinase n=1 Tax=Streptococcus hepaticus TaxID=3349163 RepID=UPI00374A3E2F
MKIAVKAPGKLYLAGEYAVVEAGYPALIMAVDQYIHVTIQKASRGTIFSSQDPHLEVPWMRMGDRIVCQTDHPYDLVESAMQIAEDYVSALGLSLETVYQISITSDLDNEATGQKYGLGSSGAITVVVVKAVLAYFNQFANPDLIYKLAVLAQMRLQMKGSFGDIAASSFGGVIAYHSVDKGWLSGKIAELSLLDLLETPWQGLAIESLTIPQSLTLQVGWTGAAASTDDLVSYVQDKLGQEERDLAHRQFLSDSRQCVKKLIQACREDDTNQFKQGISDNRQLLRQFSKDMGMKIETERLEKLCQIAEENGLAAKSSGAGGGDCGICFIENDQQREVITTAWAREQIQVLPLSIAERQ